jgi:hypothetical protein
VWVVVMSRSGFAGFRIDGFVRVHAEELRAFISLSSYFSKVPYLALILLKVPCVPEFPARHRASWDGSFEVAEDSSCGRGGKTEKPLIAEDIAFVGTSV